MAAADDLRSVAVVVATAALCPVLATCSEAFEVGHAPSRHPEVDEEASAPSPASRRLEVAGAARAEAAPTFGRRQSVALDLQRIKYDRDLCRHRAEVVRAQRACPALLTSSDARPDRAVSNHTPRVRRRCTSHIHTYFTIASPTILSRSSGRLGSCLSLNANVSSLSLPSRKLRRDRSHASGTRCLSASRSRRDARLASR